MFKVNIVIPVYNEKGNIGRALRLIKEQVKVPFKITIAYDMDEDTSLPEAKKVNEELGLEITYLKNIFGRGALNAIKSALNTSDCPYTIVTMADLSDPPRVINTMVKVASEQNSDIVCGSRYMKGGSQDSGLTVKSLLSRAAGLSLYYLFGIPTHDATNSFKLYSQRVLKNIIIESKGGFELGLEFVVKAHLLGYVIHETPTTWEDRSEGQSRFQLFNWLPSYLKWYFLAVKGRFTKSTSISKVI